MGSKRLNIVVSICLLTSTKSIFATISYLIDLSRRDIKSTDITTGDVIVNHRNSI